MTEAPIVSEPEGRAEKGNVSVSIEKLLSVRKPPVKPVEAGPLSEWTKIEEDIGTPLPIDYKQYISVFGTGGFSKADFSFLFPFNPFSKRYTLQECQEGILWVYEECRLSSPEICIFNAFPEKNGLLPWGQTHNGNALFWLTKGPPDFWDVVVCDGRYNEYEKYNLTMTGFLAGWLSGEIEIDVFPKFDLDEVTFYPLVSK